MRQFFLLSRVESYYSLPLYIFQIIQKASNKLIMFDRTISFAIVGNVFLVIGMFPLNAKCKLLHDFRKHLSNFVGILSGVREFGHGIFENSFDTCVKLLIYVNIFWIANIVIAVKVPQKTGAITPTTEKHRIPAYAVKMPRHSPITVVPEI